MEKVSKTLCASCGGIKPYRRKYCASCLVVSRKKSRNKYCSANREKLREARRIYAANNPEKLRAISLRAHHKDPRRKLVQLAKRRAKLKGLEFDLDKRDIVVPEFCPVLGIRLVIGGGSGFSDASPTLDRIDNSRGYVRDNVLVVSWRANRIKVDATVDELGRIYEFYKEKKWRA